MHLLNNKHVKYDQIFLFSPTHMNQGLYLLLPKFTNKLYSYKTFNKYLFIRMIKLLKKQKYKLKTLLLIDDMSDESILNDKGKGIISKLLFNSRWYNLNVMIIAHSITAVAKSVRDNSEHIYIYPSSRRAEIECLYNEWMGNLNKKEYLNWYNHLLSDTVNRPYIFIENNREVTVNYIDDLSLQRQDACVKRERRKLQEGSVNTCFK